MSELIQKLDAILAGQKENAEKVVELEAKVQDQSAYISKVEADLAASRRGAFGEDALKSAIPERYRDNVERFARTAVDEDPVLSVAMESWLKNAARLQMPQFAAQHPQLIAENEKLALALGAEFGVTKASMNESTDTGGVYVIPVALEAEILRQMADNGVARSLGRKITMSVPNHDLGNLSTGVTTYVVNYATDTNITQGEPVLTKKTLTAKEFVAYGKFGNDLIADASVGLLSFFFTLVAESFAAKEDAYALEGSSSTDPFEGLFWATGVNSVQVTTATATGYPSYQQLWDVVCASAKGASRRGSAWVMHPTVWSKLAGQVSTSTPVLFRGDQAAYGMSAQAPTSIGSMLGFPVYLSDQPSITRAYTTNDGSTIYFGPFGSSLLVGDLGGISFGLSEHAHFQSNQIGARVVKRTGLLVGIPANFTKLIKCKAA